MAEARVELAKAALRPPVPRRWIGVPASAWNPTMTLMVLVVVGFLALAVGMQSGRVPPWLAIAGLSVCYYVVFTVLHESMHGIAHRNRLVNATLGRIAGFALLLPYPLFRAAHHAHHGHTNDPERDPDLMVARKPGWLAPIWFLLTPLNYRWMVYGGGMLRGGGARLEALASEAAILGIFVGGALTGALASLVVLWLVPAAAAIVWLALAFDLLPHHPHTTRVRYYDTRVYPGRALNILLLGQNYHLIHHLWTTIPWYRYQRAFREVEPDLIARGAPIGWKSRAERPSASAPV